MYGPEVEIDKARVAIAYLQVLETSRLAVGKEARVERTRNRIEQLLGINSRASSS